MYAPTREQLLQYRSQGNLCPIYREILADLETPVSAYLKVAHGGQSFLLESVTGGQNVGRYSFIGSDPYLVLRMQDGVAQAVQGGYKQTLAYRDPLEVLESYLSAYRPIRLPNLPIFVGGAVGFLSYESARCFEELPTAANRAYSMPDSWWMFVDTLLAFDHVRNRIIVISHVHLDAEDLEAEYNRATARIEQLITRLQQPLPPTAVSAPRNYEPHSPRSAAEPTPLHSNFTQAEFEQAVETAKAYVTAGDVFQIVLSQRFSKTTIADSFTVYRALRTVNPSPYMFYIHTGEGDLVGASPEMLVKVENGLVETRPIAGTRWRGKDTAEDEQLANELLADEKERAEHLMLVDLGRNDVGRISEAGSVSVPTFMAIEKYSHVQHIVSAVTGRLAAGLKPIDALRACFPAGTVSGAPKIRAMQIIAELEPDQRGIYAGAVGHVGFNGDLDTCIALRTMLVKDGVCHVQAGAGIVADSTAEYEYRESFNKGAASLRAIDLANELAQGRQ
jgi:anthranilate synthase component I